MPSNFDDILNAAKGKPAAAGKSDRTVTPPTGLPKQTSKTKPTRTSPWENLEPPEREASIRLNVDIPVSLNDKLADKARQLRRPKTELVRELLEWALDESIE